MEGNVNDGQEHGFSPEKWPLFYTDRVNAPTGSSCAASTTSSSTRGKHRLPTQLRLQAVHGARVRRVLAGRVVQTTASLLQLLQQLDVARTDRQPDDAVRECRLNDRIVAERLCEDGLAEPAMP